MNKTIRIFAVLSCLLALSACVSRDQADAKLGRACTAAAKAILADVNIDHIAKTEASPSSEGPGMRHVTVTAALADSWLGEETTFDCTFEESFSAFNTGYTASVYQARINNQIYGRAGGEMLGSTEDFIKITDAVRDVLYSSAGAE